MLPADPLMRCCAAAAMLLALACSEQAAPPPAPLEIPVVEVIQRDTPITLEMVGQTYGSSDIPIRARVEGVLLGLHFSEGGVVQQGQLLYTIDPVEYETRVVEAQGHLAAANTRLAKAAADLERIRPLAEMKAVSQQDLDGAIAQHEAALGSKQAAEARLQQAQIELGYCRIASPIAGRIGISKAKVGEFVGRSPNPVVLNFVSQTDPIRVRFSIDERRYLMLARRIRDADFDAPVQGTGVELVLADGTTHEHRGRLVAAAASIDPETGTFTLEADFPNPDDIVIAGQFARVRATVSERKGALLVPQRSISELQGLFRVYVVDDEGRVELRPVELGPKLGSLRVVESGLQPGERVALEIMRLQPGMTIVPGLVEPDARLGTPAVRAGSGDAAPPKGAGGT